MHKQIPSALAIGIIVLLSGITVIFSYWKSPELRYQTSTMFRTTAFAVKSVFVSGDDAHKYAAITNDSGSEDKVLILEPSTDAPNVPNTIPIATSSDDVPTEPDEFKPSPESQWALGYLQMLGLKQADLGLDIEYVREWQQTGGLIRDLTPNSKGSDVRLAQYLLYKLAPSFGLKFDRSSITGTYGPKTTAAFVALQQKLNINATGTFDNETRFFFDSIYFKELCPDADPLQDKSYENVNRRISVPKDYIPSDLIRLPRTIRTVGAMCLSREPSRRLGDMFDAAAKEGLDLAVFSAYRSAHTQDLLTAYYLRTEGQAGLAGIAESGHSEHQLGTTVDLSGKSIDYAGPSNAFGNSPEGKWLAENSYKFGFIMSYPKGKQKDTGYIYEPWHFRYMGIDTAKDIFEEKMTIQEYLDLVTKEDVTN